MDPITILGAAGSVIGIASFGLQLAKFLNGFIGEYTSANQSYYEIIEGICATSEALQQVRGFLEDEKKNVDSEGKLKLFSIEALDTIETTADKCLKIFWRIEATALNKSTSGLEDKISKSLDLFHEELRVKKQPPVLKVDREFKLSRRQRLKWPLSTGHKLEKYNRQLEQLQTTLILMFQVISIRVNLTKPNPGIQEMLISAQFYAEIPQMAAQSGFPDAKRNRPPSYAQPPPSYGPWTNEPPGPFLPPMGRFEDMGYIGRGHRYPPIRPSKDSRRARSSSESPPRGRPKRRHKQRGAGHLTRDSSSNFDNDREAVRKARDRPLSSSSFGDDPDEPQSDTVLQHKMSVAEKRIAKNNATVQKKKQASRPQMNDPGPSYQPQPPFEDSRLTHSPVSFDEENFSILPQRGSFIGSPGSPVIKDNSNVKRPMQYQKPSVTDHPLDSPEEKKMSHSQNSEPQRGDPALDLDPVVLAVKNQCEPSIAEKSKKGKEKYSSKSSITLELAEDKTTPFSRGEASTPDDIKADVVPTTSYRRDQGQATHNYDLSLLNKESTAVAIPSEAKPSIDGASKSEKQFLTRKATPSHSSTPLDTQIPRAEAKDSIAVWTLNERAVHTSSTQSPEATNIEHIPLRDGTPEFKPLTLQVHSSPTVVQHQHRECEIEALNPCQVSASASNNKPSGERSALHSLPGSPHRNGPGSDNVELEDTADEPSECLPKSPKADTEAFKIGATTFRDVPPHSQGIFCMTAKYPSMNANSKSSPTSTIPQITLPIPKDSPDHMEDGINSPSPSHMVSVKQQREALEDPSITLPRTRSSNPNKESNPNLEIPTLTPITPTTSNVSAPRKSLATESSNWVNRALSKVATNNDKKYVDSPSEHPRHYQDHDDARSGALTTRSSAVSESETTSYVSLGSENRRKRDMVYEILKRLARRDFMTQDDVENMFSGPGCFITAFVVKGGKHHQIPYDGQFSLRKSHIKNLHSSDWWKEFAFLTPKEISSLSEIVAGGEDYFKTLVRLQWLQKERLRFWSTNQRVLVAIVKNEPLTAAEDGTTSQSMGNGIERMRLMSGPRRGFLQDQKNLGSSSTSDKASGVNNFISEGLLEDQKKTKEFIIYTAYTIRVFEPHNLYGDPNTVEPSITKEGFSEADILQRISELNDQGPQLIQKKLNLLAIQQEQIAKLLQDISAADDNTGFAWHLAQIDNIGNSSQGLRSITVYLRKTSTTVNEDSDAEVYRQSQKTPLASIPDEVSVPAPPEEAPEVVRPRQNVTFRKQNSEINSRTPPLPSRYNDSDSSNGDLRWDSDESNTSSTNSSAKTRARLSKTRKTPTRRTTDNRSPDSRLPPRRRENSYASAQDYPPFPGIGSSYTSPNAPVPPYAPYAYPMALPPGPPGYAPPFSPYGIDYGSLRSPYYPYYDPPPGPAVPSAPPPPPSAPQAPPKPYSRQESSMKDEQGKTTSARENYPSKISESISMRPRAGTAAVSERALAERLSGPGRHTLTAESVFSAKTPSRYNSGGRPQSYYGEPSQYSTSGYPAGPTAPPSQYAASQYAPSSAPAFPLRRAQVPYPEYYDGRSFNPRAPVDPDELGGDTDIVQKLLMDWTPAGEEQKVRNMRDGIDVPPDSTAAGSNMGKKNKKAAGKARRAADDDHTEDNRERSTVADKETNPSGDWGGWGAAETKKKGEKGGTAELPSAVPRPAYMVEVDDSGKRLNKQGRSWT